MNLETAMLGSMAAAAAQSKQMPDERERDSG